MDLGLRDRTVLVTGGSGGIGEAVARAFAAEDARVAVTYRSDEKSADRLAEELGSGTGRALAVRYDLAEPDTVQAAVERVRQDFGPLEVLVANAVRWGARRPAERHFEQVAPEEWWPLIAENLAPTIRTVQLAAADMRGRGWGRIVLVSSQVAVEGRRGQEFYSAFKSALHGFGRSLAADLGPDGVLVNVVCPGLTTTRRVLDGFPPGARRAETGRTATGRLSAPEDVAAAAVFLGSAANGNITGEVLAVTGGS